MSRKALNAKGLPPMLSQYKQIKSEYPDVILLFRLGDFYEMFGDDAEVGSKVLELALTSRGFGKGHKLAMCGFPHVVLEKNVARLVKAGHRAAVCEQVEDAAVAKGVVRREVTRVLSSGTTLSDSILDADKNNFLAAVAQSDGSYGLALLDISTGQFMVTEFETREELTAELERLRPSELIVPSDGDEALPDSVCEGVPRRESDPGPMWDPTEDLRSHFGVAALDGYGCESLHAAQKAAAAALHYARETQFSDLEHVTSITTYSPSQYMTLDDSTVRNLELVESTSGDTRASLLSVIGQTLTPMGARLLRNWLLRPLIDVGAISRRLDCVEAFVGSAQVRSGVRSHLDKTRDIERLMSKIALATAGPRDLVALRDSLTKIPDLQSALSSSDSGPLRDRSRHLDPVEQVTSLIGDAIADDPPVQLRDGGGIRPGYDSELDELREAGRSGKQWIAELETAERARTHIKSLRVGYNAVFGYYIEVTKANLDKVPQDYTRKQTLVNAERFVTPELKEKEMQVLGAEDRAAALEREIFGRICSQCAKHSAQVLTQAGLVAELDVLCALAEAAAHNAYTRPQVDDSDEIAITGGRHPVVEATQEKERFVPNDALLDTRDNQLLIITGPNMAGKSTYLRQVALIALLAQIGSFVPADSAKIGVVDRIFTRIGAADDLSGGRSTFLVEMIETANILNNATPRSLILLDEVGRGTSTYDGLAIAWAVSEHVTKLETKTLFATHYHHLNELEKGLRGVKNYRVTVRERDGRVIWLRKIVPGGTDRSYGIEVARMAGIPSEVVARAAEVLQQLEAESKDRRIVDRGAAVSPPERRVQLTLFEPERHPVLDDIEKIDTDSLSPIEALNLLHDLRKKLSGGER